MPAHQVINRILETAEDTGGAGEDNLYGRGIIDAHAALTADVASVDSNPMGSIADWITLHRRGEVQQPDEPEETREVAGPVDYPTELPVAAEPVEEPVIWQPIVVAGFGILLLVAVLGLTFSARKRTDKH